MSNIPLKPSDEGFLSLEGVAENAELERTDDSELSRLRELGKGMVSYLFMGARTLAIHDKDNRAVLEPLGRLAEVLEELSAAVHRTHFITVEGQIYLNDLRIKMEATAYDNVNYLVSLLEKHGIGGITFNQAPSVDDLKELLLVLLNTRPSAEEGADLLAGIRAELERANLPHIDFDRPYYFKSGDSSPAGEVGDYVADEQEAVALSYAKGVLAVKDYFRAVEAAETANPLRIRKIVHDLVDVAEEEPESFLKLHTIHGIEDPYYNHCVNVSSLAVAIGRELQLSRVELAELGGAAMFHDLGYAAVERGASSAGADDSAEWDADRRMRYHPIAGFKALLRQGEYGPGLLRRLLVTLEHHMHFRRPGGYPNLGKKRLSVYTRIVQVADHYDALVTPIDGEPGLLPVQAIERLLSASGVVFDPLAVRALVNVVGRYPYGSLVRLSSKEVGVVTSGGRTENSFLRPRVMVVRNADGSECEPREVDLAENQVIKRRVLEVLDPFTEGVTPHAVLFDQLGADDEDDGSSDSSVDAEAWNKAVWEGDSTSELLEQSAAMPAAEEADPDEAAAEPEPEDAAPVKARPGVPDPDEPTDDLPIATRPNEPAEDSDEAGGGRELTDPAIDPWAFGESTEDPDPWGSARPAAPLASALDEEREPEPWETATELDVDPDSGSEPAAASPAPQAAPTVADEDRELEPWETATELDASPEAAPEPPASVPVSSPPAAPADPDEDRELEPWERAEDPEPGGTAPEAQASPAPERPAAPPVDMSPEEVARRKAAWKKAMADAWAKGGEEAVQALAKKTWYNFDAEEPPE